MLQAAGNAAEAGRWLQRAARQYRLARMYDECLALLQEHPGVAEAIPAKEVNFMKRGLQVLLQRQILLQPRYKHPSVTEAVPAKEVCSVQLLEST